MVYFCVRIEFLMDGGLFDTSGSGRYVWRSAWIDGGSEGIVQEGGINRSINH